MPIFESGHSRSWAQLECIGGELRGSGVKSIFFVPWVPGQNLSLWVLFTFSWI